MNADIKSAYINRIMLPFKASGSPKIDLGHAEVAEKIVYDNSFGNKYYF